MTIQILDFKSINLWLWLCNCYTFCKNASPIFFYFNDRIFSFLFYVQCAYYYSSTPWTTLNFKLLLENLFNQKTNWEQTIYFIQSNPRILLCYSGTCLNQTQNKTEIKPKIKFNHKTEIKPNIKFNHKTEIKPNIKFNQNIIKSFQTLPV
jgi:hypothetical protein